MAISSQSSGEGLALMKEQDDNKRKTDPRSHTKSHEDQSYFSSRCFVWFRVTSWIVFVVNDS